jgi:hypothetical protein
LDLDNPCVFCHCCYDPRFTPTDGVL